MTILDRRPHRLEFPLVNGIARAAGGELAMERLVTDTAGDLVHHASPRERLVYLIRGTGVIHDGDRDIALHAGDVVALPPCSSVPIELDCAAELLVVGVGSDEPMATHEPSHWFG